MEFLDKMSVIKIAKTSYKINVIPVFTIPILLNIALIISTKKGCIK